MTTPLRQRDPFFDLKAPFSEIKSQDELLDHLKKSDHLRDVLYRPDLLVWSAPGSEEPRRYKIENATFQNVSFSKTKIENFAFINCRFSDCLFIGCEWTDLEFHSCTFIRCNVFKIVISNTYVDPASFRKCLSHSLHTNIGVHLFQQLMRNFGESDQPLLRDDAKFLFLRWRRWNLNYKIRRSFSGHQGTESRLGMIVRSALSFAYEKILGSGIRLRYLVAASIAFYGAVASINYALWQSAGFVDHTYPHDGADLIRSIYFSATMLSTTGMGDIVPTTPLGEMLTACEGIFGLLWFAILASMVFKKIVR